MDDENLEELLRQALEGKATAANQFARRVLPIVERRVRLTLLKIVNPRRYGDIGGMLEECTQHVFLRLFNDDWRKLRQWKRERAPLSGFLNVIAERDTISWLKGRRKWNFEELADAEGPQDPMPGPEREAIGRGELRRLHVALKESLTDLGWLMYQILFIEDLSVEEVCKKMEMSPDAVFAWRARIRKKIAQALSERPN